MNARRVKRKKQPPPAEKKQPSAVETRRSHLTPGKVLGAIVAVIGLVLGAIGAWAVLVPKVTVDIVQHEIDRYNPKVMSFLIRNTGYIPLYDVKPSIAPCEIDYGIPGPDRRICNGHLNVGFGRTKWQSRILSPDEPQTIELGDLFSYSGKLTDETKLYVADFIVRIEFKPWFIPWFIPWRMGREFRFYGEIEDGSKMLMRSRPVYQ